MWMLTTSQYVLRFRTIFYCCIAGHFHPPPIITLQVIKSTEYSIFFSVRCRISVSFIKEVDSRSSKRLFIILPFKAHVHCVHEIAPLFLSCFFFLFFFFFPLFHSVSFRFVLLAIYVLRSYVRMQTHVVGNANVFCACRRTCWTSIMMFLFQPHVELNAD